MNKQRKTAFETAVLFLVFNRPDTTKKVLAAIRDIKPQRFYIACDGPRENRHEEQKVVNNLRTFILKNVDWNCEIKTYFRDKNLGCKNAVSSAISWFFENEEMGIILEDDCLPSKSFFYYCEELLERYKNDYRIWQIVGNNFGFESKNKLNSDYLFSRHAQVWGWATWKDRWAKYDKNLTTYKASFENNSDLSAQLNINEKQVKLIKKHFSLSSMGVIDTWDYQWQATIIANGGLAIYPVKNLISNIGDGPDATHTVNDSNRTHLPVYEYSEPLKHKNDFLVSWELEEFLKLKMAIKSSNISRIITTYVHQKRKLKRLLTK